MVYEVRACGTDGGARFTPWEERRPAALSRERGLDTWVLKREDEVTTLCEGLRCRASIVARGHSGGQRTVITMRSTRGG